MRAELRRHVFRAQHPENAQNHEVDIRCDMRAEPKPKTKRAPYQTIRTTIKGAGSQAWKRHTINIGTPLENAIKNAATMTVHLSKLSKGWLRWTRLTKKVAHEIDSSSSDHITEGQERRCSY
jgi:hypothetical protein